MERSRRRIFGLFLVISGAAGLLGTGAAVKAHSFPFWVQVMNAVLLGIILILYGILVILRSE